MHTSTDNRGVSEKHFMEVGVYSTEEKTHTVLKRSLTITRLKKTLIFLNGSTVDTILRYNMYFEHSREQLPTTLNVHQLTNI